MTNDKGRMTEVIWGYSSDGQS